MKKNRIPWYATLIGVCIVVAALVFLPTFGCLRSMVVMAVYSKINQKDSIASKTGVKVNIPGGGLGTEWYPLMLMYDASSEFSWRNDVQAGVNIYYTFPSFDNGCGCSRLFDPSSPSYMGFYGAYLVDGVSCGFDEKGQFDEEKMDEVVQILHFDIFELVLDDFGLTDPARRVLEYNITGRKTAEQYAGVESWVCLDAELTVNSPAHQPQEFVTSYLQYGRPGGRIAEQMKNEEAFAPISMKGRLYGHYFAEEETTLWFYILCADDPLLEKTDKELLSKSRVTLDQRR